MQFTINIPDEQMPRVEAWVESLFDPLDENGNPVTPPTQAEKLAEFKHRIKRFIKGEVQQFELLEQHKSIFETYTQIDVTD